MMMFMSTLIICVSILISVAFYTLLERKILSYMQIRKGPNKVSIMGITQPFSDALKLLTKSCPNMDSINMALSMTYPALALMLSLCLLPLLPLHKHNTIDTQFNTLTFMLISSLSVYVIMKTGWATNSKYSYLGSMRNVAQMISYEISLFLIILNILTVTHSFNLMNNQIHMKMLWFMFGMWPMMIMWLISCTAEVNRSPFDFAEGESELVSGFNVEYSGGPFALIFLAEYTNMIVLALLTAILFSKTNNILMPLLFTLLFLWARATLPRFRYDMLMTLNWKIMLPLTIIILLPTLMFSNL